MKYTVPYTVVEQFLGAIGADAVDVKSVEIDPQRVTVTTFRQDDHGRRVVDRDGLSAATTTTRITRDGDDPHHVTEGADA